MFTVRAFSLLSDDYKWDRAQMGIMVIAVTSFSNNSPKNNNLHLLCATDCFFPPVQYCTLNAADL